MSNKRYSRDLRLLVTTSVLASAMIVAPVSVRIQLDRPAWHLEAPMTGPGLARHVSSDPLEFVSAVLDNDRGADDARREALARLGLEDGMSYEPPALLTLSQARAASGGGDGDGAGSGGGDGSGEGPGSDSDSESSGASGASGSSSGPSSAAGASGGSFGDVEQVGPSLTEEEESAAIANGWQ